MPKDEFDFEDPFELNGVGLVSNEDTTEAMTECFVEEFMRLGHNHKQILAMFRNHHYIGMNLALQKRGEPFVRDMITEVFARRGRAVAWSPGFSRSGPTEGEARSISQETPAPEQVVELDATTTDPMGAPIPNVTM